ncbi:unnamed protein product, partial [Effrenium voratum]
EPKSHTSPHVAGNIGDLFEDVSMRTDAEKDDIVAIRAAIEEVRRSIVEDVRKATAEALRATLQEEMPQALSPLLGCLEDVRKQGKLHQLQPEGLQKSPSNRSFSGVEHDINIRTLRRLSAPLQVARAAISANRAARLKRATASPETSEEVDEQPRRKSVALTTSSRPAVNQASRIPTFLRMDNGGTEDLDKVDVEEVGARPRAPQDFSPVLPGEAEDVPSPMVQELQRQSSSLDDESDDDANPVGKAETQKLRGMNSLEIVPALLSPDGAFAVEPTLWQRVARSLTRWFPSAPVRRLPSLDSFRHPRPPVTPRPLRLERVEPSACDSRGFSAKAKLLRRRAVVLEPAALEDLRRKANPCRKFTWLFADPAGVPRHCWDMIASLLLFLQLLYLPFQTAFITEVDLQDSGVGKMIAVLLVADLFFALDLVLNFTTGFRDSMQVLHRDGRSIAMNYFRSWFFIDFFATIPSLVIHVVIVSMDKSAYPRPLWWLSLSPLVRLPRLRHALLMLRKLEAHLKSSLYSSIFALVELFMLPVVFSHLSACALWALGRSNLDHDATVGSWIKLGLDISDDPGALQAVPVGERYMTAMYFAVTVMSTVGLGDISMNLSNERALLCVIMATTSLVVGVAVNGVATIVSKLNERTAVTNEQLAKVSRFLKIYSVPGDLQRRVHAYLVQFFENQEREETKSLLLNWVKKSEFLRVNVNLALTGTCLTKHHLLQLVPRDVLVNICDICDMEFHPPGQELMTSGAEAKTCFYIRRGLVQTCAGDAKPRHANLLDRERSTGFTIFGGEDDLDEIDEVQREIEAVDILSPEQQLGGGTFVGDFRLFLGTSRTLKTVTCSSFCELISIDVEKFRSLMVSQAPEIFDMLVVYSSIDHDCPVVLLKCLEEQCLSPEDPLLFGEGVLHHCAKKNADKCVDHLIEQLSAEVGVLDAEGKTPAQVAAQLKHKEVFWSMVKAGSLVTDADVLPTEVHSVARRKKRQAEMPSFSSDEEPKSTTQIREMLEFSGLNLSSYGCDGHKSLENLAEELNTCQSELIQGPGKRLRRRVQLVRLRLFAIIDDHVRALVEVQSEPWLRSPEQKLGKLPCRRIRRSESPEDALRELLLDLHVPPDVLAEKLLVTVAKSSSAESKVSMGYPGLETEYVVHECSMKVRALALQRAEAIGLPEGKAYSIDVPVAPLVSVARRYFWPVLLNIRLENNGDHTKTEDLRIRFEANQDRTEKDQALHRFNPWRALRSPHARVVEVGAR